MSEYVSGNWTVKENRNDDFVTRWKEFTQWSLDSADGAEDFVLLHEHESPRHYISIGVWRDKDCIVSWRNSPEFARMLGRCRELCDDFRALDYALAAKPARTSA